MAKTLDRISEASEKTGISRNVLRRSITLGNLAAYRVGDRGWYYVDSEQAGGLLRKCHTVNDQHGDMREQVKESV